MEVISTAAGRGRSCSARISAGGKVLNPQGFAVCADKGQQRYPRLAAGKGGYLVAWEDDRSATSWDVYGARVTP